MICLPLPPYKVAQIIADAEVTLALLDVQNERPVRVRVPARATRMDARITRCRDCDVYVLPNLGDPPVCDMCAAKAHVARVRGAA